MPDGGGYFDQLPDTSDSPFLDPRQMAWMGFAQGFGQAAMPSRMKIPFGAAIGTAAGNAGQMASEAYKNRLYSAQAENISSEAALKQNQLAGLKLMQQLYGGAAPVNRNTALSGATASMVPTADMAMPGVNTSQPNWWTQPGAVDPAKWAARASAGNTGVPAGASATAPPMWNTGDIMRQAQVAAAYGMPFASNLIDLAKSTAQTTLERGMYLGADGAVYRAPGANQAEFQKFMSGKGYMPTASGGWTIDPAIVRGEGAIAGAQAWSKAPAELYVARNTPKTLRGPGSVYYDPMTRTSVQIPNEINTVDSDPSSPTYGATIKKFVPLGLVHEGGGAQPQASGGAPPPSVAAPRGFQPGGATLPTGRTPNDIFRSQLRLPAASPTQPSAAPASPAPQAQPGGGETSFVTKLGPMQEKSLEGRGEHLEKYGAQLDEDAESSKTNNFLLDQMRRESQSWDMGRFANTWGDVRAYASAFAHTFGATPDWLDKPLGDWQAFNKNSTELTRQVVRATSSRAAVQEFAMIQKALPSSTMSAQGFGQISDQMSALNDYRIAKQQAAQLWRQQHGGTLAGGSAGETDFEGSWNASMSPAAFWVHRMPADQLQTVASEMQKTPEGRASLTRIMTELTAAHTTGLLPDLGY